MLRYDVANLNVLTGIQESKFIHTVSKNCRAAVVHGFLRKTAKGAIYVQILNEEEAESCSDVESKNRAANNRKADQESKVEAKSCDDVNLKNNENIACDKEVKKKKRKKKQKTKTNSDIKKFKISNSENVG